jgi:hypothetical protein
MITNYDNFQEESKNLTKFTHFEIFNNKRNAKK